MTSNTQPDDVMMIKRPGTLYTLCGSTGVGIYAASQDGRFRVNVSRARCGARGSRGYQYTFSAIDTGRPSGARSFSEIPLNDNEHSNPARVFEAVARYVRSQAT